MNEINKYILYADRDKATKVSLAVYLTDEYTEKQVVSGAKVVLKNCECMPYVNLEGYRVFFDLPGDEYLIETSAENYFNNETIVNVMVLEPLSPVVNIVLKPKPSYPFPPSATLIRGIVIDQQGTPFSGAIVEIDEKEVSGVTTNNGEFVLYIKKLTEDDVVVVNGKRYVRGNENKVVRLKAKYMSKSTTVDLEQVEECGTTVLKSPMILKLKTKNPL